MKTKTPFTHEPFFAVISTKRGRKALIEAVTVREDAEEVLRDMASDPQRYDNRKGRLQPVRLQFV